MRGREHHKQRYRLLNIIIRRMSLKYSDGIALHEEVNIIEKYIRIWYKMKFYAES